MVKTPGSSLSVTLSQKRRTLRDGSGPVFLHKRQGRGRMAGMESELKSTRTGTLVLEHRDAVLAIRGVTSEERPCLWQRGPGRRLLSVMSISSSSSTRKLIRSTFLRLDVIFEEELGVRLTCARSKVLGFCA